MFFGSLASFSFLHQSRPFTLPGGHGLAAGSRGLTCGWTCRPQAFKGIVIPSSAAAGQPRLVQVVGKPRFEVGSRAAVEASGGRTGVGGSRAGSGRSAVRASRGSAVVRPCYAAGGRRGRVLV